MDNHFNEAEMWYLVGLVQKQLEEMKRQGYEPDEDLISIKLKLEHGTCQEIRVY